MGLKWTFPGRHTHAWQRFCLATGTPIGFGFSFGCFVGSLFSNTYCLTVFFALYPLLAGCVCSLTRMFLPIDAVGSKSPDINSSMSPQLFKNCSIFHTADWLR